MQTIEITRETRRLALGLAGGAALTLLAMVAVTLATGASQEQHEHYAAPAAYAARVVERGGAVRLLMGLDVAFLCLYTAFFATLARVLRGRPLATLALVAMVAVGVLDIVEDHHILALLSAAEANRPLDDAALVFQQTLSSTKFSLSYLGLLCFGLAIPRRGKLAWTLAIVLVIGAIGNAIADFAIPPADHAGFDGGRWIGFLVGFGLAAAWLGSLPVVEATRDDRALAPAADRV